MVLGGVNILIPSNGTVELSPGMYIFGNAFSGYCLTNITESKGSEFVAGNRQSFDDFEVVSFDSSKTILRNVNLYPRRVKILWR